MPSIIALSLVLRQRAKQSGEKTSIMAYERSTVQIRWYEHSQAKYVSTGEEVETLYWDAAIGRLRIPNRLGQEKALALQLINEKLETILTKAKQAQVEAERTSTVFSAAFLKGRLQPKVEPVEEEENPGTGYGQRGQKSMGPLLDLFQVFIDVQRESKTKSKATLIAYGQSRNQLAAYCHARRLTLTFDTLTPALVEHLAAYMRAHAFKNSTIAKTIKDLKVFCKWAADSGHGSSLNYQRFRKPKVEPTDFAYLTQGELDLLADAELPPHLERVRDVFLFQAETGLRHSDLVNLRAESRQRDVLKIITIKTKDQLTIPLSPKAISILSKYDGSLPATISNQPYNREIKEACRLSGISDPVLLTDFRAGERIETTRPKHELVTSHTARRTFIIHALERGVRPEVLMRVTGHKDIKTMMGYVKISQNIVEQEFALSWKRVDPGLKSS